MSVMPGVVEGYEASRVTTVSSSSIIVTVLGHDFRYVRSEPWIGKSHAALLDSMSCHAKVHSEAGNKTSMRTDV